MYKKSLSLFVLFFIQISILFASAPVGYYTSSTLDGKNTSALRTALQAIITGQTVLSYTPGLWDAYQYTDLNSSGKIWDMYSNCSFTYSASQCGTYSVECDCYNREHSTPQSWFGGNSPMYTDLFNVYPTDGKVNGMRSNYPYGEVGTASYTSANGSKLGTSNFTGYTGIVFEPIDEYKGDFARTYFYMATRYAGTCETWPTSYSSTEVGIVYGNNLGFTQYAIDLFLKWSREDPVSQKETDRNDAVYGQQNNRNPFIDFPGLEEYIWGNKTTETTFSVSGSSTTAPSVTTPTSTNITSSTADLGGNITSTGNATITESGVYYSSTNGFADGSGTKVTGSATTTGVFSVPVSSLSPSSTYYYKAFATNSVGTGYSAQGNFTTSSETTPSDGKIKAGNVKTTGETLDYGKVTESTVKNLLIQTADITGDLTVAISGSGFSASASTITQADATNGYNLQIIFTPSSAGSYSGTLTISGGGLTPYEVSLSGSM